MGDEYPTVRAAAVQAASVFLDREASIDKAACLIREAGRNGARLVAFPEGFVPAHPIWFHFHAASGRVATTLSVELFKNAVEIPGPEIETLQAAAADARAYVVVGVCEKLPGTFGTLYNSQVFLGPDGSLIGKRQKLMPTVGERLVHAGGQGETLQAFQTDFGPASALICGENSNPLAIFALTAQYPLVHVQSWPSHFPTFGDPLRTRVMIDAQAFAQMSKAWVVAACGTVDERAIEMMELTDEQAKTVRDPAFCGGSLIVNPMSQVVAGPLGHEEEILYADMDLELGIRTKLRHDFAGHYNRPDIFHLTVSPGVTGVLSQQPAPSSLESAVEVEPHEPPALAALRRELRAGPSPEE
jgi:nitrilase